MNYYTAKANWKKKERERSYRVRGERCFWMFYRRFCGINQWALPLKAPPRHVSFFSFFFHGCHFSAINNFTLALLNIKRN